VRTGTTNEDPDRTARVRDALLIIITCPEFAVQK
jgi:hypothetical protein